MYSSEEILNPITVTCPHCNVTAQIPRNLLPKQAAIATCHTCKKQFLYPTGGAYTQSDALETTTKSDDSEIDSHVEFAWETAASAPKPFYKKRVTFLAAILLVLLISLPWLQQLAEYIRKENDKKRWRRQDITEQMSAPSWNYDLQKFSSMSDRKSVEAMLRQDRFNLRCSNGKGIRAEDTSLCWMVVKDIWGVPGIYVGSFFNSQGQLNSIRLAFTAGQYQQLSQALSQRGSKATGDLGVDGKNGPPMEAWIFDSGIAYTSNSLDVQGDIMVLFTTRRLFEEDVCTYKQITQQHNENNHSDCGKTNPLITEDLVVQLERKWGNIPCGNSSTDKIE